MTLRYRIQSNPETLQDLALASDEKYWEGVELLVAGRHGAGIYLLGYAVEMILKVACFVTEGARPFEPVQPRLGPTCSWARRHLPHANPENYQSLRFWAQVLRKKRSLVGRSFSFDLEAGLLQRAHRLHGIWVVGMRYKPDETRPAEAETMLGDVNWIRDRKHLSVA